MVLAKVAEMPEPDRATGKRLHVIIKARSIPLAETLDGCRLTTEPSQNIKGK